MIVLDSNVLLYAVGGDHPLAAPCKRLVDAIGAGRARASTTPEVIQEFAHIYARRRSRREAASLGQRYVGLLSPLLIVEGADLTEGLRIFERHPGLGAFDAVLAAVALGRKAEALVSADRGLAGIKGLRLVDPATPALDDLLGEG